MVAPTFVAEYETVWNTTTTPKTVSVTTAVGDVLVVIGMAEGRLATLGTPTGGTGLTWTLRQEVTATPPEDWATAKVWTAVATTAETFNLSIARAGTAQQWGWIAMRWSGSDGVGASSKTNVSGGAPSLGLTTTGDNSAICVGNSDWNAIDGASRTWRTVNGAAATEQAYFRSSTSYALYAGRHNDAGTAGAKTVGLSAPSGQKYSIVAVEVLGTSGGSPQTVTPTGIATGAALGSPAITTTITTSPTGIATSAATGTPTVSTSITVSPSGIATGAATGTPSVSTTVTVSPTGIASAVAVGAPALSATITVAPSGISSATATGTPQVTTSVTVEPTGVPTGAAVGTPSVVGSGTVSPTGIPSGEQLGTPTISTTITTSPGGVATSTATGNPAITTSLTVAPSGISSGAALGTPVVTGGASSVARTMPLTLTLVAPQRNLAISPIPVRDLEVVAPERKVDLITPVRHLEINMTDTVKYGDTHSISMTITDGANVVVDLTGTTIRLLAKSGDAATVELDATLDADPTTGVVHHVLTGTLPVGTYDVEAEDTLGVVKTTSPTVGYAKLIVAQDLG